MNEWRLLGDFLPPFREGDVPSHICSRWIVDHNCGRPATWHIIWTVDLENGTVCDEHLEEARREWVFFAVHPYEPSCAPPALFFWPENFCRKPEDDQGVSTVAYAEANA